MYLRHEAGHAFNYAYRLYTTPEWRELFGPFHRPLPRRLPAGAVLAPVRAPHRRLVRAEAPRRGLRRDLRRVADAALAAGASGTRAGRRSRSCATSTGWREGFGDVEPDRRHGDTDITVEEMETTVEEFYQQALDEQPRRGRPRRSTTDLARHLQASRPRRKKGVRPAAELHPREPRGADRQGHVLDGRPAAARASGLVEVDRQARVGSSTCGSSVGRRSAAPDRGDRLRDDARDELPDAREVRPRREGASPEDAHGRSCKIAVLYDVLGGRASRRRRSPRRRVARRKKPQEEGEADREEIFEALKASSATSRSTRCSTARPSRWSRWPRPRRPGLQPDRVVRRRRHQGHEHRGLPRPARASRTPAPGRSGLYLAQDKALAKKIFAFHGIKHAVLRHRPTAGKLDHSHDICSSR